MSDIDAAGEAGQLVSGQDTGNAVDDVPTGNPWSQFGALVVAGGPVPADLGGRKVIAVERRLPTYDRDKVLTGSIADTDLSHYPAKADVFIRYDEDCPVPPGAQPFTMGVDLIQFGFSGMSPRRGAVCVGPASAVYAAVNVAYLEGARDVKVIGLTEAERDQLAPWFATALDAQRKPLFTSLDFSS